MWMQRRRCIKISGNWNNILVLETGFSICFLQGLGQKDWKNWLSLWRMPDRDRKTRETILWMMSLSSSDDLGKSDSCIRWRLFILSRLSYWIISTLISLNTFPHSLEDVNERVLVDLVSISWFISYEEDTLYSLNEIYSYSIIHEYLIQVYSSWPWPGWCGAVAASSCIKGTASTNSGPDTLANSQQQQWMSIWTHLITHIGNKSMKSIESAFSSLQLTP